MFSEDRPLFRTVSEYISLIKRTGLKNDSRGQLPGLNRAPVYPGDKYMYPVSLLISPLHHLLETAMIIDEGEEYRLAAARNSRTVCDRRFNWEKFARSAFTAMFSNFPHSQIAQVWTPYFHPAARWLKEKFPDMELSVKKHTVREKTIFTKRENGLSPDLEKEFFHTQNRVALDFSILSMSHLNMPFTNLDDIRVSMLCNPIPFFIECAYIIEENNRYKLIVTRHSYLILKKVMPSLDEACRLFRDCFVKHLPNKNNKARWSDFFYPPKNWLRKRLRILR